MYLDNVWVDLQDQGHRSKVRVTADKKIIWYTLLAKLCVMVAMTAKLILLYSSPFLHWPTFCVQNVYRIRYICPKVLLEGMPQNAAFGE